MTLVFIRAAGWLRAHSTSSWDLVSASLVFLHGPVNTSHSKQNALLGAGDKKSNAAPVLGGLMGLGGKAGIKKIITDIIKATKRKSEGSVEMLN